LAVESDEVNKNDTSENQKLDSSIQVEKKGMNVRLTYILGLYLITIDGIQKDPLLQKTVGTINATMKAKQKMKSISAILTENKNLMNTFDSPAIQTYNEEELKGNHLHSKEL
jgi:hypothetical protein